MLLAWMISKLGFIICLLVGTAIPKDAGLTNKDDMTTFENKDKQDVDNEPPTVSLPRNVKDEGRDVNHYMSMDQITTWVQEQATIYKSVLTVLDIGKSWEGRPLHVIKVVRGHRLSSTSRRPAVWIDAGVHANEWIGPAALIYFTKWLLTAAPDNLVNRFNFYILPVFNVDGYTYTWSTDRYWRKSRSINDPLKPHCVGVDINRNWDVAWNDVRNADKDPCSNKYVGPYPFSEPELRSVVEFLQSSKDISVYLSLHNYGQMWLRPFAFTSNIHPIDELELRQISEDVVGAIFQANRSIYRDGTPSDLIGPTSGSSIDYTYLNLGIKYSFGMELPDDGREGLNLSEDWIGRAGSELIAAIIALCRDIA